LLELDDGIGVNYGGGYTAIRGFEMTWINRNIITNICAAALSVYGGTEAIAGRMNLDKAMRTIGPTIALFFTGSKDGEMADLKKRLGLSDRDVEAAGNIGLIALNQFAHRLKLQVTHYDDNSDRDYRGSGRRMPGGGSDRVSSLLDVDGVGNYPIRTGAGLNEQDRLATEPPFLDYGRGGSGNQMGAFVAPGDDLRAIDPAVAAWRAVDKVRKVSIPGTNIGPGEYAARSRGGYPAIVQTDFDDAEILPLTGQL
jgi:hypothetical protein